MPVTCLLACTMAEESAREKSPSILATEPFQLSDSDETCCNSPLFNDQLVSVSGTPIKLWKAPIFRFACYSCYIVYCCTIEKVEKL